MDDKKLIKFIGAYGEKRHTVLWTIALEIKDGVAKQELEFGNVNFKHLTPEQKAKPIYFKVGYPEIYHFYRLYFSVRGIKTEDRAAESNKKMRSIMAAILKKYKSQCLFDSVMEQLRKNVQVRN